MSNWEYGAAWGTHSRTEVVREIVDGIRCADTLEEAEEYLQQYVELAALDYNDTSKRRYATTYEPVERFVAPRDLYPDWPNTDRDTVHPQYRVLLDLTAAVKEELDRCVRFGWADDYDDFAEKVGVHPKTLTRMLNGDGWPSLQALLHMEYRLGTRLWPASMRRKTRERPVWQRANVEAWGFETE